MKRYKFQEASFIKLDFSRVNHIINKDFLNKKSYIVYNNDSISFGGTFQYKKADDALLFGVSNDVAKFTIRKHELKEVLISDKETDDTIVFRYHNNESFVIFDLNLKIEIKNSLS